MNDTARAAAQTLVNCQWPEGTMASSMSCIEAETVADFIEEAIGKEAAMFFLQAHSVNDEAGDLHDDIGKTTRKFGIGWGVDVPAPT